MVSTGFLSVIEWEELTRFNEIFHISSFHVVQVQQVARVAQRHCHCPSSKCNKLKVKKVGEGRYNIAGRNVFIRVSVTESLFFHSVVVTHKVLIQKQNKTPTFLSFQF